MMIKYITLILSLLLLPIAAHAQCTTNNNSSFTLNGTTLSANGILAQSYTACIGVTMPGTSNSGTSFPVQVSGQGGTSPPTISVNGLSTGATATTGSSLTIAVANGPGNPDDWIAICNTGTPSSANCNSQYNWSYLNCSTTPPTTGLTSATCSITAPLSAGSYNANFLLNNGYTVLASASFTVTGGGGGGGGGPGTPYGNIPCPRGCTWTVAFSDDFTVDTSFSYDRTANVTNALWYVPPDGSGNPTANTPGPGGTFACDQGALDTSHLPGYLAFHAVGTAAWEAPNNLSCGIFPKVSTTYTPVGCSDGWYTESCIPIPGPVIYEYKAQLALNQIFEVQVCCSIELYFYESRGNGVSFNGGKPHVIGGESLPTDGPVVTQNDAPHVIDVLVDPQAGYSWYTDGNFIFSGNPGNCPNGTCDGTTATYYMFNDAISNACGGACSPGGTTALYWVKEFRGY